MMVLGKMRRFLPSHCIPDELEWVESIPMTTHGENNSCTHFILYKEAVKFAHSRPLLSGHFGIRGCL